MLEANGATRVVRAVGNRLKIRKYSPRTCKAYLGGACRFVNYIVDEHHANVGADDVRRYLLHLVGDPAYET